MKTIEGAGFTILGYAFSKSPSRQKWYYFRRDCTGGIARLATGKGSGLMNIFIKLAALSWWELNFPRRKRGGIHKESACKWLITQAELKGEIEPPK
jgi:hypothetical protein